MIISKRFVSQGVYGMVLGLGPSTWISTQHKLFMPDFGSSCLFRQYSMKYFREAIQSGHGTMLAYVLELLPTSLPKI